MCSTVETVTVGARASTPAVHENVSRDESPLVIADLLVKPKRSSKRRARPRPVLVRGDEEGSGPAVEQAGQNSPAVLDQNETAMHDVRAPVTITTVRKRVPGSKRKSLATRAPGFKRERLGRRRKKTKADSGKGPLVIEDRLLPPRRLRTRLQLRTLQFSRRDPTAGTEVIELDLLPDNSPAISAPMTSREPTRTSLDVVVSSLRGNRLVNDEVMNEFVALLNARNKELFTGELGDCSRTTALQDNSSLYESSEVPPGRTKVFTMNTYFFHCLTQRGYDYSAVRRWTLRARITILDFGLILFPVNISTPRFQFPGHKLPSRGSSLATA